MSVVGAVALATVLVAGGRELPKRPTRYLVLWCGGVRKEKMLISWYKARSEKSPLAEVLRKHGVSVEEHVYYTTVKGERYRRFKLIVRDEKITRKLVALAHNEVRLRRLMKRFESVVQEVLFYMGRISGWRRLLDLIPARRVRRWLGIRPFKLSVYKQWRDRKIARMLKPNWRAWSFKKLLIGMNMALR